MGIEHVSGVFVVFFVDYFLRVLSELLLQAPVNEPLWNTEPFHETVATRNDLKTDRI